MHRRLRGAEACDRKRERILGADAYGRDVYNMANFRL